MRRAMFNVIALGNEGVGKSSLLALWRHGEFSPAHVATIGLEFKTLRIEREDLSVKLEIWDTGGGVRFGSINKAYIRGKHMALVAWNPDQEDLEESVRHFLRSLKAYATNFTQLPILFVATKSDEFKGDWEAQKEALAQLATSEEFGLQNFEILRCSAKTQSKEELGKLLEGPIVSLLEKAHPASFYQDDLVIPPAAPEEKARAEEPKAPAEYKPAYFFHTRHVRHAHLKKTIGVEDQLFKFNSPELNSAARALWLGMHQASMPNQGMSNWIRDNFLEEIKNSSKVKGGYNNKFLDAAEKISREKRTSEKLKLVTYLLQILSKMEMQWTYKFTFRQASRSATEKTMRNVLNLAFELYTTRVVQQYENPSVPVEHNNNSTPVSSDSETVPLLQSQKFFDEGASAKKIINAENFGDSWKAIKTIVTVFDACEAADENEARMQGMLEQYQPKPGERYRSLSTGNLEEIYDGNRETLNHTQSTGAQVQEATAGMEEISSGPSV